MVSSGMWDERESKKAMKTLALRYIGKDIDIIIEDVTLVRKYFRLHAHEPPDRIYAELLGYTRPVVSGRADKRNMKPKLAVWFVYRVA